LGWGEGWSGCWGRTGASVRGGEGHGHVGVCLRRLSYDTVRKSYRGIRTFEPYRRRQNRIVDNPFRSNPRQIHSKAWGVGGEQRIASILSYRRLESIRSNHELHKHNRYSNCNIEGRNTANSRITRAHTRHISVRHERPSNTFQSAPEVRAYSRPRRQPRQFTLTLTLTQAPPPPPWPVQALQSPSRSG